MATYIRAVLILSTAQSARKIVSLNFLVPAVQWVVHHTHLASESVTHSE